MGFALMYCVPLRGKEFNRLLPAGVAVEEEELGHYHRGAPLEFKVPGADEYLSVRLTEYLTLVMMGWNYSAMLANNVPLEAIQGVERLLRSVYPHGDLYRLDEYLVSEFEEAHDLTEFENEEVARGFLRWLRTQDPLHWSLVPE